MKRMDGKKLLSVVLCIAVVCAMTAVSAAPTVTIEKASRSGNSVTVKGTVNDAYGNQETTILVVPKDKTLDSVTDSDIKYINQESAEVSTASATASFEYNFELAEAGEFDVYVGGSGVETPAKATIIEGEEIPVIGVELNKDTLTLEVGKEETLVATVLPENATNKSVTWESSDENIADVDDNGKVTAKAAGTATITVTTVDGGFTDTCTVTVVEPSGDLEGDVNRDGTVNLTDLQTVLNNFGKSGLAYTDGDINEDGIINLTDLQTVLNNFGRSR